jgi:predicted amidohydrolase
LNDLDVAAAMFENVFDQLESLNMTQLTWVEIAKRLLRFCYDYAPPASSWEDLDPGEPCDTIENLEKAVLAELIKLDPTYVTGKPGRGPYSQPVVSSFATQSHVKALRRLADEATAAKPFGDGRMSYAAIARALAGAIDILAGSTFLEWFKQLRTVRLVEGEACPVLPHNPSRWVGNKPNTDPHKFPTRELWATPSLRIATNRLNFDYVLDFGLWDRLSALASERHDLTIAVAQPNLGLGDFTVTPASPHTWYANHGPGNMTTQLDRITRLLGKAEGADLVLLPEYAVSADVYAALNKQLPGLVRPIIFCAGVTFPDANDYVKNQAWLYVSTPGIGPGNSVHFHAKTSRAYLGPWEERIHTTSEVRVFVSQQWNLCVLICIETLSNEVLSQLAEIGANLLLVPAMSSKTNTMTDKMSTLCSDSQAFVAMANGPASWPTLDNQRYEAFFAGPYADSPRRWGRNRARGGHPPTDIALWEFSSSRRRVTLSRLPS